MSTVTCHLSFVTCHLPHVYFIFIFIFIIKKIYIYSEEKKLDVVVELVGGGFVINGAYPVKFSRDGQKSNVKQ